MFHAASLSRTANRRLPRTSGYRPAVELLEERTLLTGALDPTFGTAGLVLTNPGAASGAVAVSVQADGKTVVAATLENNGLALIRYEPDGQLDRTFGTNGVVTWTPETEGHTFTPSDAALQGDGKIVVAGTLSLSSTNNDFLAVRFNADGTLDDGLGNDSTPGDSFGANGTVRIDFNNGNDTGRALAIYASDAGVNAGKIVLGGNSSGVFALARLNPDGSFDSTFGFGGLVSAVNPGIPGSMGMRDLLLLPDGGIVTVGNAGSEAAAFDIVVQFTVNGVPDVGFGTEGVVALGSGSFSYGSFEAVVRQADGKLVVAGARSHYQLSNPGTFINNFLVARFNADGSLDNGFGNGGLIDSQSSAFGSTGQGRDVVIQDDGRIVVAGYAYLEDQYVFALARYLPNGTLDPTFGTGGEVTTIFPNADARGTLANALAFDATGDKVVVVGYTRALSLNPVRIAVARYELTGEASGENQPPSIQVIGNQFVAVGNLLQLQAIAQDPDGHDLTFSLDAGAPAGAAVDAATGVFTWTPTAVQVGGYTVTLRVTDNGNPPLSASETFLVVVISDTPSMPMPYFPSYSTPTTVSVPRSIIPGDINGDGIPETIRIVRRGGRISVEVMSGSTLLRTIRSFGGGTFTGLRATLEDVDGDGVFELVVRGRRNGKRFTRIFRGAGLN